MPLASQPAQATSASAAAAFQPPAAHAHHHSQQQQRAHRLHHPRPISSSAATAALRFGLPLACRATAPAAAGHHNSRQGSEAEGSAAMYVCVSSAADDTDASASEDMRSPQSSSEAIDTDGCASSSSCNSPIPPRVLTDHPYGALSGGETLFPSSTSSGVVPPAMHGLGPRKPSTGRGRSAVVASTESELEESDSSASYTSFRCNPSTHHSRARPSLRVRSVSSSSSSASAAADARTTSRSTRPRVLVTGGAGFIGSHVARALLERGEDLVIVDELNDYYDPALKIDNLRQLVDDYGHSRVHTYVADICDAPAMQKCYELEHYDRIIHLAARAGVRPSLQDPLLYERSNVQGTLTLLELVKNSKGAIKHFVYASSSSVYGDDACVPFSENDPCNTPVSVYAATKKSCELLATTYAQLYQIPCSGLRFFTVFGPGGQ
jgi:hypothetical protein